MELRFHGTRMLFNARKLGVGYAVAGTDARDRERLSEGSKDKRIFEIRGRDALPRVGEFDEDFVNDQEGISRVTAERYISYRFLRKHFAGRVIRIAQEDHSHVFLSQGA